MQITTMQSPRRMIAADVEFPVKIEMWITAGIGTTAPDVVTSARTEI
jgi:hypothetical protein